jgi:hypothetical protein
LDLEELAKIIFVGGAFGFYLVSCKKNLQTSTKKLTILIPGCNAKITFGSAGGLKSLKGGKDCSGIVSDDRRDMDLPLDLSHKDLNLLGKERIAI